MEEFDEATFPIKGHEYDRNGRRTLLVLGRPKHSARPLRRGQYIRFEDRQGYARISSVEEGVIWVDDIDLTRIRPDPPEAGAWRPASLTRVRQEHKDGEWILLYGYKVTWPDTSRYPNRESRDA